MMASNQLQLALGLPDLNPIQRARFSALLEEVRAAMPKNRKNTVADDNGQRPSLIRFERRPSGECAAALRRSNRSAFDKF